MKSVCSRRSIDTFLVNDKKSGAGGSEGTISHIFSGDDFIDIDKDTGAPVTEDYDTLGGRSTGQIAFVTINIGQDAHVGARGLHKTKTALAWRQCPITQNHGSG